MSWYPGVEYSSVVQNRLVPAGFLGSRTSGRYRPTPTLFRRWCDKFSNRELARRCSASTSSASQQRAGVGRLRAGNDNGSVDLSIGIICWRFLTRRAGSFDPVRTGATIFWPDSTTENGNKNEIDFDNFRNRKITKIAATISLFPPPLPPPLWSSCGRMGIGNYFLKPLGKLSLGREPHGRPPGRDAVDASSRSPTSHVWPFRAECAASM